MEYDKYLYELMDEDYKKENSFEDYLAWQKEILDDLGQ